MRITKVMLDATLEHINKQTKIEHTLEGAYGGWKLCRTVWDTKGGENVFHTGYMPKRELYNMMQAYARGIELLGVKEKSYNYRSTEHKYKYLGE